MKFAALKYNGVNIGDEIQTLAAMQFPSRIDKFVNRDRLGLAWTLDRHALFMNGWYMNNILEVWGRRGAAIVESKLGRNSRLARFSRKALTKSLVATPYSWPPSPRIDPCFVAFHISNAGRSQRVLTSGRSLRYLRRHGPVGCRDHATRDLLLEKGVDAYFSGCLTLTLERPEVPRSNQILFVDMPRHLARLVPEALRGQVEFRRHYTRLLGTQKRYDLARRLLRNYAAARLVLTTRLHCALPCVAFGTPVIFFTPDPNDPRFGGLLPFVRHAPLAEAEAVCSTLDWVSPPENPPDSAEIAEDLRRHCAQFVTQRAAA